MSDDENVSLSKPDQSAPEAQPDQSFGLGWRILIAAVALAVIGGIGFSLFRNRALAPTDQPSAPIAVETPAAEQDLSAQADPDSPQAQFELGNQLAEMQDWEGAIAAYQRAIELDPTYQAAHANLGVVYYQTQQLDLAAEQYQQALDLAPDDGEVAYNLGALYLQQALTSGSTPDEAMIQQAIEELQRAQELTPSLAEPHFSLGVAYTVLGDTETAIEEFETFLELTDSGGDPVARQEAERYLQQLRSQ